MNWAHIHLLINHIPVLGSLLITFMLIYVWKKKQPDLLKFTYLLMVLVGIVTLAVYFTGEPAEGVIEHLPGVQESLIEAHEDAALFGLILTEVVAALGIAGLYLKGRDLRRDELILRAAVVASLINAGLMGYAANLGGKIMHSEIRGTVGSATSPHSTECAYMFMAAAKNSVRPVAKLS